jgi:hypothetical protein
VLGEALSKRDLVGGQLGQVAQRLSFVGVERARFDVEHTERADPGSSRRLERGAGVEPDAQVPVQPRDVGKAFVLRGVFDDEQGLVLDRVDAKRVVEGNAIEIRPEGRVEPLPLGAKEGDEYHGNVERLLCEPGDPAKRVGPVGSWKVVRVEKGLALVTLRLHLTDEFLSRHVSVPGRHVGRPRALRRGKERGIGKHADIDAR